MSEKKILVIDDDRDIVRGISLRLKAKGYQICCAPDGVAAVSMARKEKPDLILLDIGLPGGDGFVVMERLKSLYDLVLTPVIVISGMDPETTMQRALDAGARAYFLKPFDNDKLMAAIEAALTIPVS
jgi:DNA-binding response OmpR family regulator